MKQLELQLDSRTKLIVQQQEAGVLVELLIPQNLRDGHGWALLTQVKLDTETVNTLASFLKG